MTDEQYAKLTVTVRSLANSPDHVKCPRCWHYTHAGIHNHDGLCDRCCNVLLEAFPDHPSVPFIKANYDAQQAHYKISKQGQECIAITK